MARSASIILSKEEKKAVVTELKAKIKAAQVEIKLVATNVKTAIKAHLALLKEADKTIAARTKELTAHQAQHSALTAPQ